MHFPGRAEHDCGSCLLLLSCMETSSSSSLVGLKLTFPFQQMLFTSGFCCRGPSPGPCAYEANMDTELPQPISGSIFLKTLSQSVHYMAWNCPMAILLPQPPRGWANKAESAIQILDTHEHRWSGPDFPPLDTPDKVVFQLPPGQEPGLWVTSDR